MSSTGLNPVTISGSGLWTPEHTITNQELVTAYNEWASRYNDRHAAVIAAGEQEPKPLSTAEFIEKLKLRHAIKEIITN